MSGNNLLFLGLALFMVPHLLGGMHAVRSGIVGAIGDLGYKGVHSVLSLIGLVLIVIGFGGREFVPVYEPPLALRPAPLVLMPLSFILFFGAYLGGFKRITRHPMAWGIVLFAVAHLLVNGDVASVALFGSFLVFGLVSQTLSDQRKAADDPEGWAKLSAETSAVPFLAMIRGVDYAGPRGGILLGVIVGIVVTVAVAWAHPYLFGTFPY